MYAPITTPCILSNYVPDATTGYVKLHITTASGRREDVREHRLVYAKAHNMSLADMKHLVVMHKCDIRNCVNPEHLMLGTHTDNMRDKMNKRRHVQVVGVAHGKSKLTVEQVLAIRAAYATGRVSQDDLAAKFGIRQGTIYQIVHRRTWTHI